ncbi:MAG: hypothetical protein KC996_08515 [Phycisphaerales bacterium]|nr:hypothetical protein [Phycisphaerales bacterium]
MLLTMLGVCAGTVLASPTSGEWIDATGDAVIRRTDLGNDAPLPPGFEPIDLLSVSVRGWIPSSPTTDLYSGSFENDDADFVRIQMVLAGLVSPPGPLGFNGLGYNPYQFGDRPIFGFIGLDIDHQKNSGGELMPMAQYQYLANVGRFGLSPSGSIADRMVRDGDDVNSNFYSGPQFERSGAEFSLAFCGCFATTIVSQDGDMDSFFDSGETWEISGRFFERMQSFIPLGGTFGGSEFGSFDPLVELRFEHDAWTDETTVTLVFPITNHGAALAAGESDQPLDGSLLNHTSLEEAIDDLILGADFASGSLSVLVDEWTGQHVDDYRQPDRWEITALLGSASTTDHGFASYIWTDTGFDELTGDFNLDGFIDGLDTITFTDYIDEHDGGSEDGDGAVNGEVAVIDFGSEFNFFDLDYDGVVSMADLPNEPCPADFTGEGTLDIFDVFAFLDAFNLGDLRADFTGDTLFDIFDVFAFLDAFNAGCP